MARAPALAMGAIPIVQRVDGFSLYDDLPVVQVDDWSQVHRDIAMTYIVMAHKVMAYIVMAYIVDDWSQVHRDI